MITNLSDIPTQELLEGAQARFVHTEAMTVAYWTFEPGVSLPEHAHPHEQVINVIEGVFELTLDGQRTRLEPGSVAMVQPDAVHSGRAITACRIIDIFHPVREDYR
jgi:quercetin dioxygenase-like cupin family protein